MTGLAFRGSKSELNRLTTMIINYFFMTQIAGNRQMGSAQRIIRFLVIGNCKICRLKTRHCMAFLAGTLSIPAGKLSIMIITMAIAATGIPADL